jgi:hypothetical protein
VQNDFVLFHCPLDGEQFTSEKGKAVGISTVLFAAPGYII